MIDCIKQLFKKKTPIPFGQGFFLTELPVCTFRQGDKNFNFLLDTGSNDNLIDLSIKDSIEHKTIEGATTHLTGVEGKSFEVNAAVLSISYKDQKFTDVFMLADLSAIFAKVKKENGVTLHGIIGSKFFYKHQYVLDFKELIAYSKK